MLDSVFFVAGFPLLFGIAYQATRGGGVHTYATDISGVHPLSPVMQEG